MPDRIFALLVVLLVGGCSSLNLVNPFSGPDTALMAAGSLTSPDLPDKQRKKIIEAVKLAYNEDPSAENKLALAVVYGIPGERPSSTHKALMLLNGLDTGKLSHRSKLLAHWLSSDLTYRESLEHSNAQLGDQLDSLKKALARAREKIEILTHIEQTIGPAPGPDQSSGGQNH